MEYFTKGEPHVQDGYSTGNHVHHMEFGKDGHFMSGWRISGSGSGSGSGKKHIITNNNRYDPTLLNFKFIHPDHIVKTPPNAKERKGIILVSDFENN